MEEHKGQGGLKRQQDRQESRQWKKVLGPL